jgi:DNA-binding FadR family transcriptional regulator
MSEHRVLVDFIAARDVEGARNASRVHIENAEHTLMQSLSPVK